MMLLKNLSLQGRSHKLIREKMQSNKMLLRKMNKTHNQSRLNNPTRIRINLSLKNKNSNHLNHKKKYRRHLHNLRSRIPNKTLARKTLTHHLSLKEIILLMENPRRKRNLTGNQTMQTQ
uniref:Uncharacterized protein n=1 Tax=Cacopsylla melanoneura TaxID=428564 RepID=A0A8D8SS55_9HEMI